MSESVAQMEEKRHSTLILDNGFTSSSLTKEGTLSLREI